MTLSGALDVAFIGAGIAALVALLFFVRNSMKYSAASRAAQADGAHPEYPVKSTGFFMAPILICLLLAAYRTATAKYDTLNFMNNLSNNYSILVEDQPVSDREQFLAALRTLSTLSAHHSHPTRRIHVRILDEQQELALELGRDSGRPQEYWVYRPDSRITNLNDIGRIVTPVFDKY
jgi:hypothetical protein